MSNVDHPSHYNQGKIEVIDFIQDQKLGFCEGNAVKYICRAEHKGKQIEDLKKAIWYLNYKLNELISTPNISFKDCTFGDVTPPGMMPNESTRFIGEGTIHFDNSPRTEPKWEAVPDDDGEMWRVRWSLPDLEGRYYWVGHYPTKEIPGQHMAERQAEEWNRRGKRPETMRSFQEKTHVTSPPDEAGTIPTKKT